MTFYAEPRMTRDIDLVVECAADSPAKIVRLFQKDCYINREAIQEAVTRQGKFNIIQIESVMKADFIVRRDSEYHRLEFERKRTILIDDAPFSVVTPEDLFLSKLQWWKETDSALQQSDLELLKTQVDTMDWSYIVKWAEELGLTSWLQKLKK